MLLVNLIFIPYRSFADPGPGDPVPFWPLDPGSGMGKNQDPGSGSGMNNPDQISESLKTIFWG